MSLLVVGSIAFDSVETPFGKRDDVLGGSASYLATAASLFTKVQLVGVVGEDFPPEHLAFFRRRGIDTEGLRTMPGRTFRWRGHYDHDLNVAHTLETQLNVFEQFEPELPRAYRQAPFVVLGNIAPQLQERVLGQVERPVLVAADSMNFWIDGSRRELEHVLRRVHMLCINDSEARLLSGETNLLAAARTIRAMGPRLLVIKRGEYGALMFSDDGVFAAPAFLLENVRDPTGAGDSFAGGMMGWLSRIGRVDTVTLRQAMVVGIVIASFTVEQFSIDRLRNLTLAQVHQRMAAFQALTHVEATSDQMV